MLEFSIRDAELDDIERIFEIELESFVNPWRIENYTHEFKIPFSYMFVAEHQNRIIGFINLWLVNDEIHLNKIAVCDSFRKMGIAAGLISFILKKYDNIGIRKIYLEVREKNKEARIFYKKLGFNENGLRKNYYPNDNAILIEKDL
jgi:[ribosomal protein S18]-alanine N-acetyltransferase